MKSKNTRLSDKQPEASAGGDAEVAFNAEDRLNLQIATLECVLALIVEMSDDDPGDGHLASAEMVLRHAIEALRGIGAEVSELQMIAAKVREVVHG